MNEHHYRFVLYIAGQSTRSERATAQLMRMCDDFLVGRCELVVIDVLEHPDIAESEKILATPTLVKEKPPPKRRVTGDLSDLGRVMSALGVIPADGPDQQVTS